MSDLADCRHRIGHYDTEHHRRIHDETEEKPIEVHGASFRSTVPVFTIIPQSLNNIRRTLYFPHNRFRIDKNKKCAARIRSTDHSLAVRPGWGIQWSERGVGIVAVDGVERIVRIALIHGIERIVGVVCVHRVNRIPRVEPVHGVERVIRRVGLCGIQRIIWPILVDWIEDVVIAFVLLCAPDTLTTSATSVQDDARGNAPNHPCTPSVSRLVGPRDDSSV